MTKICRQGLDDRCRDDNGTIRRKRRDTLVQTLRDEYGDSFASGIRGDAKLGTVLDRVDANSLTEYFRNQKKHR